MPVPSYRVPVKIARGTYANLSANVGSLEEGEICYANDENALYVVEGGVLTAAGSDISTASIDDLLDVDTSTVAPTDGQVLTWVNANSQWEPADASGGVVSVNGQTGVVALDIEDLSNVGLAINPASNTFLLSGPTPASAPSASGEWSVGSTLNNFFTWYNGDPIETWLASIPTGTTVEFVTQGGYVHTAVNSTTSQVNSPTANYMSFAGYSWPQEILDAAAADEPITVRESGSNPYLPPTDGQVLTWVDANSQWEPATPSGSGGIVGIRQTVSVTTASIAAAASDDVTLAGTGASGDFIAIETDKAAWVVVYSDTASRTADSGRAETTAPASGSGVLLEVVTTGAQRIKLTPHYAYFNDEGTPASEIYLKVTNKSGSLGTVTVTATVVPVEG